ncbi:MAG: chromosome segregation protein SMC, partial [Thermodesulfobacteriota bacterium]
TVFTFDAGISAILGPNGCGKSNVVDAVRWVMGEQSASNLRGQAMGDVIFAGSDTRRAHGMAEVSLVFDNSGTLEHPPVTHALVKEYAEIMVTRRLYRSGESEYLLNKTPCRLKDITELFLDTGVGARAYSIIEQGKVASVLQARPEERRVLIEEAAGISKYKARRKTALRKIEGAQHNLERVDDIVSEVGERLNGLERQAREAREFRELRQQMRELDIGLGLRRLNELQQRHTSLQQAQGEARARLQQCETDMHQGGLDMERCRIARDEADSALAQKKKQLFAWRSDLQECENASTLARQQRENHARQKQEGSTEIVQIDTQLQENIQRLDTLQQHRDLREHKIKQMEHAAMEERRGLDAEIAAEHALRRELDSARATLKKTESQREGLRKKLQDAQREQAVLDERQALFSHESARSAEALKCAQGEKQEHHEQLSKCAAQVEKAQLELQQFHEALQQKKDELKSVRLRCENTRQEYQQANSRLESLRELVESRADVETPVQDVLQDSVLGPGFEGILVDGIKVKPEHEVAVAAVLEERLEALRFAPGVDVAAVLARLRNFRGRHVCQLDALGHENEWDAGVAMAQVVEVPPGLQGVMDGAYLVEDITTYIAQPLPMGIILVTQAGEVLTWQGRVSLGHKKGPGTTLLQNRRRIAELEHMSGKLQNQVDAEDTKFEHAHNLYVKADESLAEQQLECERLHLHQREAQHNFDRLKQQCEALEMERLKHEDHQLQSTQRLESLQCELALLEEQEHTLTREVEATRKQVEQIEQKWEQARLDLQVQQQRSAEQRSANAVAAEQFKTLSNDIKHAEQDIAREKDRLRLLRQRQEELDTEISALERHEKELHARTDVLLEKLRASKKSVARAQEELDGRSERLRHAEQREREQRTALYQARQKLDSTTLELEHNSEDVARQQQWLEQTYAVKPEGYGAQNKPLPDDAQRRLKRLQRRIENFGEVNLLAVDEYDALSARHTFLLEQQEDLLQSIADLRKAIAQINRKSRSRFKKTFSQVNEQFMYVFPRLFSGGNARLVLTEPEDMLATGIDIEARPPGKKLQNINLLSGGEKALTAVALIFAIFQIKPSPFCILDEVDAPLDHANIGRFNAMVREMATTSQFVIITHNTRTMEIADTLYGVTMEDPGVSRLVSVDMSTYAAVEKRG